MGLNETIVSMLRGLHGSMGSERISVEVNGVACPVTALVTDRGVCELDGQTAGHSQERGRLAKAFIVAADLPAVPERGDYVTMLGEVWQLRYCQPIGLAGKGLLALHCVSSEHARLR